ncbi:MAG: CoA-transferase [Enterobacterales bacterium endosymbiont of Blomia tropicalis]|uniref:CoA transferase subunit A n=1 Tax=Mixta mediterraneensis TaxID=2758443 RepID=UPI0025A704DC|nr:CoA-transferase [Mixta mediterraneensis]MDL4915118.1 CoA-transferase [Mixta mediterraneensis]
MKRTVKLTSLKEAVSTVRDGERIALGGFAIYQRPMALTAELVRQKKRQLTLIGILNGIEADLLTGAGVLHCIETSYVGLERFGLARNFRRAAESGVLKTVDYPELIAWDRFRASQEGLPFWPCTFLGGSGVAANNPDIVPFACPVTARQMWAVPPANPDVVLLHAPLGDEYGNVAFHSRKMLPQSADITLSRCCDRVIVSVEKIVSPQQLSRQPHLVEIPAFRTTHIVEAPFGAHPTSVPGIYDCDERAFWDYVTASATPQRFAQWLQQHITGVADHQAYLDQSGNRRLLALRNMAIPQ